MSDSIDHFFAEWATQHVDLPPLDGEMQFVYRIARVSKILGERLDASCARHGLTRSQFEAMAVLRRRHPVPLSAQDLMDASFLTSGSVTAMLRQLVAMGLVTRSPDPVDGRRIQVSLTPRGITVIEAAVRERLQDNAALARLLPETSRAQLNTRMRDFLSALESLDGDPAP